MNKASKIYIDKARTTNIIDRVISKGKDLNKRLKELKYYNAYIQCRIMPSFNNLGLLAQVNASKGSNAPKLTYKILEDLVNELSNSKVKSQIKG